MNKEGRILKHVPKLLKGIINLISRIPFGISFNVANIPPIPIIHSHILPIPIAHPVFPFSPSYGLPNNGFFSSGNQVSVVEEQSFYDTVSPLNLPPPNLPFSGIGPSILPFRSLAPISGLGPPVLDPELLLASGAFSPLPSIHLRNLIESQYAKGFAARTGQINDNMHDDSNTHRHNTGTSNTCFVNCNQLSHQCENWRRHSRQSGWKRPSRAVLDLPVTCGLHEVCCNLANLDSTFAAVGAQVSSTSLDFKTQCGQSTIDNRVVGRVKSLNPSLSETKFGEFPWQVAILKKEGNDNVYICAGTLVDPSHVITAAHCIDGYRASQLRARMGEWDVNKDSEFYPHIEYDVIGSAIHPDYFAGNLMNDIALVRMLYPVDIAKNPHISPICLPAIDADFSEQRCWVSGWGKDNFGNKGKYQNLLKKVEVPILSTENCESILRETRLGPSYNLHKGMLCAGGENNDACTGDGGGPLSCADVDGSFVLIGIVSWGIGCGENRVPGIYTNVEQYVPWIKKMTES